jgi:hypothetical protein
MVADAETRQGMARLRVEHQRLVRELNAQRDRNRAFTAPTLLML